MKSILAQTALAILQVKGCQFASLTYLSKTDGSVARYNVNLGFSYHTCVTNSVLELKLLIRENKHTWNTIQRLAAASVMKSLRKTLRAHALGQQNDDYTKKDQYIPLAKGLNVNSTDNTLQLFGLLVSKVVLVEGNKRRTNSAQLTIEKNKLRKLLPVGNFREFALDIGNIAGVRIDGQTLEILPTLQQFADVGIDISEPAFVNA